MIVYTMIKRVLSIQISMEPVEIKSLLFIDDTLDIIIIHNMKKMITKKEKERKEILLQVLVCLHGVDISKLPNFATESLLY